MWVYCPTQKKKVPSLEVDRDAFEIDIMTRRSRGMTLEEKAIARKKAAEDRKARIANYTCFDFSHFDIK